MTQDIKYHVLYETSIRKLWEILKKKLFITEHMNNYTNLINLINVDVNIKEDDNALILLNSLPDEEYETFVLTLIDGKQTIIVMYQLLL